jgi:hypothetical protein
MTDVVDRAYSTTSEARGAVAPGEARRVLIILVAFVLVTFFANFWF